MAPIPIERSASPPIFSRAVMAANTRDGSRLSPRSSTSVAGSARRMRGMNRSRICAPQVQRPVELNAKPATGRPARLKSVTTATIDVVISEKSKLEFLRFDLSGIAVSRMSTMRMGAMWVGGETQEDIALGAKGDYLTRRDCRAIG